MGNYVVVRNEEILFDKYIHASAKTLFSGSLSAKVIDYPCWRWIITRRIYEEETNDLQTQQAIFMKYFMQNMDILAREPSRTGWLQK